MRVIRLVSGVEIRLPLDQIESITDIEPVSGSERPIPPHPYLHREGVRALRGVLEGTYTPVTHRDGSSFLS